MGRPTKYTTKVADTICERLADGESLKRICSGDDMPSKATVFRWLDAHKQFRDMYVRAREAQADSLADEIIDIADDGLNDTYVDDEGRVRTDHEVIARSRLRVDARKWLAAKLRPRRYGERIEPEEMEEAVPQRVEVLIRDARKPDANA